MRPIACSPFRHWYRIQSDGKTGSLESLICAYWPQVVLTELAQESACHNSRGASVNSATPWCSLWHRVDDKILRNKSIGLKKIKSSFGCNAKALETGSPRDEGCLSGVRGIVDLRSSRRGNCSLTRRFRVSTR